MHGGVAMDSVLRFIYWLWSELPDIQLQPNVTWGDIFQIIATAFSVFFAVWYAAKQIRLAENHKKEDEALQREIAKAKLKIFLIERLGLEKYRTLETSSDDQYIDYQIFSHFNDPYYLIQKFDLASLLPEAAKTLLSLKSVDLIIEIRNFGSMSGASDEQWKQYNTSTKELSNICKAAIKSLKDTNAHSSR